MKRKFPKEMQKKEKQDLSRQKTKLAVQNKIVCKHCGENSGWTNDVLAHAKGELELKCKQCGQVCVKIMCKSKSGICNTTEIENVVPNPDVTLSTSTSSVQALSKESAGFNDNNKTND